VDDWLHGHGYDLESGSPDFRKVAREFAKATQQKLDRIYKEDSGAFRTRSARLLGICREAQEGMRTLLFPGWVPTQGRASPAAEEWFRDFLLETGLRDEMHGQILLGMHAFRHTLLHHGFNKHLTNIKVIA